MVLRKVRLQPHLQRHLRYAVANACMSARHVQASDYDPTVGPNAAAKAMGIPWDLRGGHAEDQGEFCGNQKKRPSGRYANSGGFKKRCGVVYTASGKDPQFNLQNPHGERVHSCTHLTPHLGWNACDCKGAVTTASAKCMYYVPLSMLRVQN